MWRAKMVNITISNTLDITHSIIQLLITIIGTFIAVYGSILIFRRKEGEERKKEHLNRIKQEVLKPWSENDNLEPILVNKSLFEDLNNHFPTLIEFNKKLRSLEDSKKEILNSLIAQFKDRFKLKEVYPHFEFYLFEPEREYFKPRIENDELRCPGFIIAKGSKEKLDELSKELDRTLNKPVSKELRSVKSEIQKVKEELKKEIEFVQSIEKLNGSSICEFIK
ncbi:hypothetical protein HZC30_01400 [Candidatus Woesearchaeota archaeon]|nr:hypothetical protein [Candidatus Woesearchaeota archaeon]